MTTRYHAIFESARDDIDRIDRRSKLIEDGPKPRPGYEFVEVAARLLAAAKGLKTDGVERVRRLMVEAIKAGELPVIDMFTGLRVAKGGKCEMDSCWVSVKELSAWANVDISATPDPKGLAAPEPTDYGALTVRVSTREDTISDLIKKTWVEAGRPLSTARVWTLLVGLASSDEPPPPLLDAKPGIIIYSGSSSDLELNQHKLKDRLRRLRKLEAGS